MMIKLEELSAPCLLTSDCIVCSRAPCAVGNAAAAVGSFSATSFDAIDSVFVPIGREGVHVACAICKRAPMCF